MVAVCGLNHMRSLPARPPPVSGVIAHPPTLHLLTVSRQQARRKLAISKLRIIAHVQYVTVEQMA